VTPARLKFPKRIDIPLAMYPRSVTEAYRDLYDGRTKIDFGTISVHAEAIYVEAVMDVEVLGYCILKNDTDDELIEESRLKFTSTITTVKRSGNLIGHLPDGEKVWTLRVENKDTVVYFRSARIIVVTC